MTVAAAIPSFDPHGAPVSVLVDYDGTISLVDITDALLARFVDDPAVGEKDRAYDAGSVGSRELMTWNMEVLPHDAELLRGAAAALPQDVAFPTLVAAAREHGAHVEVVSDGLGFYVASNLATMGVVDVPIATNDNRLDGPRPGVSFPYGHPSCFVCGTCKRERVRIHQAAGRAVVFVGDGASDRFAAAHADVVFAKDSLARICRAEGLPFRPWHRLGEVTDWLEAAFDDGSLPRSAGEFGAWRARFASPPRPFICGPEVWGPGRTVPGPGPQ